MWLCVPLETRGHAHACPLAFGPRFVTVMAAGCIGLYRLPARLRCVTISVIMPDIPMRNWMPLALASPHLALTATAGYYPCAWPGPFDAHHILLASPWLVVLLWPAIRDPGPARDQHLAFVSRQVCVAPGFQLPELRRPVWFPPARRPRPCGDDPLQRGSARRRAFQRVEKGGGRPELYAGLSARAVARADPRCAGP